MRRNNKLERKIAVSLAMIGGVFLNTPEVFPYVYATTLDGVVFADVGNTWNSEAGDYTISSNNQSGFINGTVYAKGVINFGTNGAGAVGTLSIINKNSEYNVNGAGVFSVAQGMINIAADRLIIGSDFGGIVTNGTMGNSTKATVNVGTQNKYVTKVVLHGKEGEKFQTGVGINSKYNGLVNMYADTIHIASKSNGISSTQNSTVNIYTDTAEGNGLTIASDSIGLYAFNMNDQANEASSINVLNGNVNITAGTYGIYGGFAQFFGDYGRGGIINLGSDNSLLEDIVIKSNYAAVAADGGIVNIYARNIDLDGLVINRSYREGTTKINAINDLTIRGDISNLYGTMDITGMGKTELVGNIRSGYGSNSAFTSLRMTGPESFLRGAVQDVGYGETTVTLTDRAKWELTASSSLEALQLTNGIVDMLADGNAVSAYSNLQVHTLSGTNGLIKQDIDVRSMESDKIIVTEDFSGTHYLDIYQKDNYVPTVGSNEGQGLVLARVNGDGVFIAKDREGTLFRTHYDLAEKNSATAGYEIDWYLNGITQNNDTVSVKSIMNSSALNYYTWRTENNSLLQRMGELRQNGEKNAGIWFRIKGSKIGRNGNYGFENKYATYQIGYDKVVKRSEDFQRYQGVAFSYTDGDGSYVNGNGDNNSKTVLFYNTDMRKTGHYLDIVLKASSMGNDFSVFDMNSKKITGKMNTIGVGLSAEFGRKASLSKEWYIEPQVQLSLGYLGGDDYITNNDIHVKQSGINSALARVGFNFGKEINGKSQIYAKVNLFHEFGGASNISMRDTSGNINISDNYSDTWVEYGIGAAIKSGTNNYIYLDLERSGGSGFSKEWQWNIGTRWSF